MQLPPFYAIRGESLEMICGNRRERWRPGGPEPGAWWQTPGSDWERFEPALHLPTAERISCRPVNFAERGWQSAYQFLLGHWSEEVRTLIRPLPGSHWRLLLRSRDPAFQDLLFSHRPLAAFLCQSVDGEKEFAGLVGKRRRAIIAALGLPGTDAVVRLLARVSAEDLTLEMLEQLRTAFRGEAEVVRRLTHLPRMNLPLLRILMTPEYRRAFQFEALLQVGRAPTEPATDSIFPRLEQAQESSGRVRAIRKLEDLDRQWSSSRRPITEKRREES